MNNNNNQLFLQPNLNRKYTYIVAVSGGADSMALLHLCALQNVHVVAAHVNYGLRGAESDRDEACVKNFCVANKIKLETLKVDSEQAFENGTSVQEKARAIRYTWFAQLQKKYNAKQVVVAHHVHDNAETVLMNIARGTGLHGLQGMQVLSTLYGATVLRPLLHCAKKDIEAYCALHHIPYVIDSSNAHSKYTRNAMRNEIISAIEKNINPSFTQVMQHNIEHWQQVNIVYRKKIEKDLRLASRMVGNDVHIHINALRKLQPVELYLYELLHSASYSYAQCREVAALLKASNGKKVESATHQVFKWNDALVLAALGQQSDAVLIYDSDTTAKIGNSSLNIQIHHTPQAISNENALAQIDFEKLEFPLLLRPWRQGDYFYPLGMNSKQKIARYLINIKASPLQKANTYVLESNKKIVWVLGMRISDKYKITSATRKIFQISLQ